MSSQFKTTTTTDDYFKILEKKDLNPEDLTSKISYEDFISHCQKYEEYLSQAATDVLSAYNSKVMALTNKENKTDFEKTVLQNFQNPFDKEEKLSQEGPVRKLAKTGYIDAAIILVIRLNLGFIIAMTILER